ncbi:arginyl-tRNA--protein transferase 1 isoform X5 [Amblyraja radiata]|uniref:arginyl-tRNA--protein transferase 1 isoform X5 n=1 Tax=Amblyraja radiata TaxID=386614 RepID=UPI001402E7B5|nr:arginyl-tRNA--protein transferase 1 isoform X5 [Amblyraja radiata]
MAAGGVSILEYFIEDEGYKCGYCKGASSSYSNGMWAHTMTVQDYQDLIDRGWRRSGMYVYKPAMNRTCCPQYAIRCHILDFKLAKSSKKVLKKMTRFLSKGDGAKGIVEPMESFNEDIGIGHVPSPCTSEVNRELEKPLKIVSLEEVPTSTEVHEKPQTDPAGDNRDPGQKHTSAEANATTESLNSNPKPGRGPDPDKPPCRKAKDLRRERKLKKLLQKQQQIGMADVSQHQEATCETPKALLLQHRDPQGNQPKSLEELTSESLSPDAVHQLEYTRFLCQSPLQAENPPDGPDLGYGSFHQQYWLDGKIIAVGVIDILPRAVSSVYLYYDPDYAFLSLGVYSAVREIAFTTELQKIVPDICCYYMGFYIHSCPKMKYKGQYYPSELLCPETYNWVPIEKCRAKLDQSEYSRLHENPNSEDENRLQNLNKVLILYRNTMMPYNIYRRRQKRANDEAVVQQYANLVGQTCAERMVLYRN